MMFPRHFVTFLPPVNLVRAGPGAASATLTNSRRSRRLPSAHRSWQGRIVARAPRKAEERRPSGQRDGRYACLACAERRSNYRPLASSTNCVCVTTASARPASFVIFVVQTIVRRPRWIGVVSPITFVLTGAGARKLVFDSIVVVP